MARITALATGIGIPKVAPPLIRLSSAEHIGDAAHDRTSEAMTLLLLTGSLVATMEVLGLFGLAARGKEARGEGSSNLAEAAATASVAAATSKELAGQATQWV